MSLTAGRGRGGGRGRSMSFTRGGFSHGGGRALTWKRADGADSEQPRLAAPVAPVSSNAVSIRGRGGRWARGPHAAGRGQLGPPASGHKKWVRGASPAPAATPLVAADATARPGASAAAPYLLPRPNKLVLAKGSSSEQQQQQTKKSCAAGITAAHVVGTGLGQVQQPQPTTAPEAPRSSAPSLLDGYVRSRSNKLVREGSTALDSTALASYPASKPPTAAAAVAAGGRLPPIVAEGYVKKRRHKLMRAGASPEAAGGGGAAAAKDPWRHGPVAGRVAKRHVRRGGAKAASKPNKVWKRSDSEGQGNPAAGPSKLKTPKAKGPASAVDGYRLSGNGFKIVLSPSLKHQALPSSSKEVVARIRAQRSASRHRLKASSSANSIKQSSKPSKGGPAAVARLRRIGQHVYKVQGTGSGQTLTLQTSLDIKRTADATAARRTATAASSEVTARLMAKRLERQMTGASEPKQTSAALASFKLARQRQRAAGKLSLARPPVQRRLCPVFCRTGKCRRAREGTCKMLHDPEKVAVCPAWLVRSCSNQDCKKQHKANRELMPICAYFLQNRCTTDSCPYLHVNLNPAAPVCQAFLNGYCAKGSACPMKHFSKQQVEELRSEEALKKPGGGSKAAHQETSRRSKTFRREEQAEASAPQGKKRSRLGRADLQLGNKQSSENADGAVRPSKAGRYFL